MHTVSKLETSLRDILESNAPVNDQRLVRIKAPHDSLPTLQALYQDLVQRLIQQEDLITPRMELLHENTARKMFSRFTHVSKVKYLVLALFLITDILRSFV